MIPGFVSDRRVGRLFLLFLLPLFIIILYTGCTGNEQSPKPRNIILMIGDGMGTSHIYAAMVASGGHLNLERCEYVGFQKTYSNNSDITDSGASGTAMATGIKTNNGAISVDPEGKPVKTILEYAEEKGLATGLLATSTITHATPAAFSAHNPDRGKYEEIALDITSAGIEVIMGGGRYHFNRREDELNLLDTLSAIGYFVGECLEDIPADHGGPVIILADTMALPPAARGRGDLLPEATEMAVGRLAGNLEGFFLMVEGSQIDWASHDNDTEYLVSETVDFDKAVGKALDFAEKDGETLVIITADHETGGFSILKGGPHNPEIKGAFASGKHTGVMVPVFAYGPGAEFFSGIYENTEIFEKMKALLEL